MFDTPSTDILPLRKGHTLVVPKAHISRLSELPSELAAAIGESVTKVARSLTLGELYANNLLLWLNILCCLALENTALNVVCNQEYAQAVPHVRLDWIIKSIGGEAEL